MHRQEHQIPSLRPHHSWPQAIYERPCIGHIAYALRACGRSLSGDHICTLRLSNVRTLPSSNRPARRVIHVRRTVESTRSAWLRAAAREANGGGQHTFKRTRQPAHRMWISVAPACAPVALSPRSHCLMAIMPRQVTIAWPSKLRPGRARPMHEGTRLGSANAAAANLGSSSNSVSRQTRCVMHMIL